jgi:hypothetical protein
MIQAGMATLPVRIPARPARRRGARAILLDIDPGYQRMQHAAKTVLAVVLAASVFEFEGRVAAVVAAACALVLMQCAAGRTVKNQWRAMLMAGTAQMAILGIVVLVSPVSAAVGLKALPSIAGAVAISGGVYFFLWPRSNMAAFLAALQLQCEHTAHCLDALSACLLEPSVWLRREACLERERVRNAVAFNQQLVDDRMAAPVLETVRPVVRCMYDVLECLAVLDKAAGALSHLNSASCNARAGVAAGLHEFSARFRELRREPSSPPAILGDLQAEATGVPVETGYERLLLFGTLFWMRRMDAVQRQFERELASLPADIIPQS